MAETVDQAEARAETISTEEEPEARGMTVAMVRWEPPPLPEAAAVPARLAAMVRVSQEGMVARASLQTLPDLTLRGLVAAVELGIQLTVVRPMAVVAAGIPGVLARPTRVVAVAAAATPREGPAARGL